MRFLLVCLILLPSFAFAQQTTTQPKSPVQLKLEASLGALIIDNMTLRQQVEELTKQLQAQAQKDLEAKKDK